MAGLASWLSRLRGRRFAPSDARWVVLDVESSGLDPWRSQLLAIAAIALRVDWSAGRLAIDLGDSFEVFLRQEKASSRENILLHGIGAQKQQNGLDPATAMAAFRAYVGDAPLLAFHSAFDEALIGRSCRQHLGMEIRNPWVDIEHLCAVTHQNLRARALDDWMLHFDIQCAVRHQAAADTLAECEVMLRIWPRVLAECTSWKDVARLAARQRWITRA